MKRSITLRSVVLGSFALPLFVGCVSYPAHQDTRSKLEQAQLANRDLVRKLNQLQLKLSALEVGGPGGVSPEVYERAMARVAALEEQLAEGGASMSFKPADFPRVSGAERAPRGGLMLGEALLFNEGEHRLKRSALGTLDELAALLKTEYPSETYIIEGHTDNQPIIKTKSLYPDNWELGYKRARAVYVYLHEKHSIPKERMILMTFGYQDPLDPATANTDEGRSKNRRVVIRRGGARI